MGPALAFVGPGPDPDYPKIPVETPKVELAQVQSHATGLVGLLVLLGGLALITLGLVPRPSGDSAVILKWLWRGRWMTLLGATTLAMVLYEVIVVRVYRRHFDFTSRRTLGEEARSRIAKRYGGAILMLGLAWAMYCIVDYSRMDLYLLHELGLLPKRPKQTFTSFFEFLMAATVVVVLLGPLYFWLSERFVRGEAEKAEDEEMILAWEVGWRFFALMFTLVMFIPLRVLSPSGADRLRPQIKAVASEMARNAAHPNFRNLLRWGLVKFFFLPWMLVWFLGNCGVAHRHVREVQRVFAAGIYDQAAFLLFYKGLLNLLFLVDLALATIGYTVTMKLLDTHVKSAEATLFGWLVAMACYRPFNGSVNKVINHGGDGQWIGIFSEHAPLWLFVLWSILILALLAFYVWATVIFGLRFSNLTNRGILCKGPYAIIRHPAYISKNTAWWLMSAPFLRGWVPVFALLGWNLIYFLRALTEERHLRQDPHYREYCKKVRWRFIPGLW